MNYYDEEITISGPDSKHLSSVQMDRPSRSGGAGRGSGAGGGQRAGRQRNLVSSYKDRERKRGRG